MFLFDAQRDKIMHVFTRRIESGQALAVLSPWQPTANLASFSVQAFKPICIKVPPKSVHDLNETMVKKFQ